MGLPLSVTVELTQISCGSCGGTYAINERYRVQCERHARCWTCPYCKASWGYPGKTEAEKERERHQNTLARLNAEIAERERLARKLKRVERGTCPHCNRSFQKLGTASEVRQTPHQNPGEQVGPAYDPSVPPLATSQGTFVMVPREPTVEMQLVAMSVHRRWNDNNLSGDYWRAIYQAMLNAAQEGK